MKHKKSGIDRRAQALSRRRFLKKSGTASIAGAMALHLGAQDALANESEPTETETQIDSIVEFEVTKEVSFFVLSVKGFYKKFKKLINDGTLKDVDFNTPIDKPVIDDRKLISGPAGAVVFGGKKGNTFTLKKGKYKVRLFSPKPKP